MNSGKVKNFVLDTNVVLHDPQAITKFGNNNVIIPIYVVEEVDNFKKQLNELGRAARQFSRTLDEFREQGNLAQGVTMPNGGLIRVLPTERQYLPQDNIATSKNSPDTLIMSVALRVKAEQPDVPCIFITKDTNLRIRADGMGLDKTLDIDDDDAMGSLDAESPFYPCSIGWYLISKRVDEALAAQTPLIIRYADDDEYDDDAIDEE